jgi:hypothetical protein
MYLSRRQLHCCDVYGDGVQPIQLQWELPLLVPYRRQSGASEEEAVGSTQRLSLLSSSEEAGTKATIGLQPL